MSTATTSGYSTGYQSTPALPDAEGQSLLKELWSLYGATMFDHEDGKHRKVRQGSNEERHAIANLECAIIKAGAKFQRHQEFTAWLCRNNADLIEAYDPIRGDLANEFYDLKNRMEWLVGRVDNLSALVTELTALTLKMQLKTEAVSK
jgi:hypothetical protein